MGNIGKQLLFKLRPIASGNHGHFDDREKVMQQSSISASRDDLLSASVPSRSNTISFFTILPPSEFMRSQLDSRCYPASPVVHHSGSPISNKTTALLG
jgi:hypothetical protein